MMRNNNYNNELLLKEITNLRVLLHETLYNNEIAIQELLNDLTANFSIFTIEFDPTKKIVQLKIKKTNMRKIEGDLLSHYYQILNNIFIQFFIRKSPEIWNLALINKDKYSIGSDLNLLSDPNVIHNLYTITLISDNIIRIHL